MRTAVCATAALAALALLAGCSDAHLPDVEQVARDFAAADPATRCDLLTDAVVQALEHEEPTGCPVALEELPLGTGGVVSAQVWGQEAQVRLTDDTLFLSRTPDGWEVAAAGCEAAGEGRYDCLVEGS
ncbi:hypothetical protein ACI8AA_06660 [Geodermatophilus sp. SYSU D01180]